MTRADGTVRPGSHRVPLTENASLSAYYDTWLGDETILVRDYVGDELTDYLDFVLSLPHTADDEGYQHLAASPPERIVMTDAIFSDGTLGVMSSELLEPEAHDVLERFARALSGSEEGRGAGSRRHSPGRARPGSRRDRINANGC